ncbi:hypothetical protein RIR_jg32354.t1 [Rhizophagus irregularis DAOM 181602=DAOM 197198]|nr:hypothetical protein RIR_jg32354.t1 [Rhizophagus irregularis DAOM 181602=DAOM 197198]
MGGLKKRYVNSVNSMSARLEQVIEPVAHARESGNCKRKQLPVLRLIGTISTTGIPSIFPIILSNKTKITAASIPFGVSGSALEASDPPVCTA